MRSRFIPVLTLLMLVLLQRGAAADTIVLNNGRTIDGMVLSEEGDSCIVKLSIGEVKFNRSDIKEIKKASAEDTYLKFGANSLNSKSYDAAIEQFKKALEINPDCNAAKEGIAKAEKLKKEAPPASGVSSADGNSGGYVEIPINPMIELDFKKKSEIYSIRKGYVMRYPGLAPDNYEPSDAVFGQIEDGKPWWGILGLSYYGPGDNSIKGEAEESRFIVNPFIMIAIQEPSALKVNSATLKPKAIYPRPKRLYWKSDRTFGKVAYNVSNDLHDREEYLYPKDYLRKYFICTYNARDFGFNYLYLDRKASKNVEFADNGERPVSAVQYIHCGGSCGYQGGCNNASPDQAELYIIPKKLPAVLYVKLWRSMPENVLDKADMVFEIDMN